MRQAAWHRNSLVMVRQGRVSVVTLWQTQHRRVRPARTDSFIADKNAASSIGYHVIKLCNRLEYACVQVHRPPVFKTSSKISAPTGLVNLANAVSLTNFRAPFHWSYLLEYLLFLVSSAYRKHLHTMFRSFRFGYGGNFSKQF